MKSAICRTRCTPRPAPTLFFFPGLSSRKIYEKNQFSNGSLLQPTHQQLRDIQTEYKKLRSSFDTDYTLQKDEHQLHSGKWDWNSFLLKGKIQQNFLETCPSTVSYLENLRYHGHPSTNDGVGSIRLMTDTPFSFVFFSTLHRQTSIAPHYGPCNLRLRCHLPIFVPSDMDKEEAETMMMTTNKKVESEVGCGMKIGEEVVRWTEGIPLMFDDCYEHSVWNFTSSER